MDKCVFCGKPTNCGGRPGKKELCSSHYLSITNANGRNLNIKQVVELTKKAKEEAVRRALIKHSQSHGGTQ